MLKCIALGTVASFSYLPTMSDIKGYIAKKRKIKESKADAIDISEEE